MNTRVTVETIPLSQINPAPYNPRVKLVKGDPDYEDIENSLETFGLVELLVWNKRSGNLVGGHQRFNIVAASGAKDVQVSVVDLDDAMERALNLRLNKTQGRWDYPLLKDDLDLLSSMVDDISVTGYSEDEVERVRMLADPTLAGDKHSGEGAGEGPEAGSDEPGRFIFVYETGSEKEALANKLHISGDRIVYTIEDIGE